MPSKFFKNALRIVKGRLKPVYGFTQKSTREAAFKKLDEAEKMIRQSDLQISDRQSWKKGFRSFVLAQPSEFEVAEAFYQYPPRAVRTVCFQKDEPILIVLTKNEIYRMHKFLPHYRRLGVKQFAVIDNGSTDGTVEYLMDQKDVALFEAVQPYRTNRREAWINRIIAYYGFDRWYIIVDSDELLVYDGAEKHEIGDLIHLAEKNKIKRIRGILLDMYPKTLNMNGADDIGDDPYSVYTYFDTDTYTSQGGVMFEAVRGGFRKRIFGSDALLTKYPVVYFEKGDIQGKSHFEFPYRYNLNVPCWAGLLHYKFLSGDMKKIRDIAASGNYFGGSTQYKQYINVIDQNAGVIDALYSGSQEYANSHDIVKTGVISGIQWE